MSHKIYCATFHTSDVYKKATAPSRFYHQMIEYLTQNQNSDKEKTTDHLFLSNHLSDLNLDLGYAAVKATV